MKKSIAFIIVLLLSANVLAKPAPTGGKACETFDSFYDDSMGGIIAKSREFTSTDAELASRLARGGFEANQIKYRIAVRNNCRSHVEVMEKQYENKSSNQDHTTQKDSGPSDTPLINSMSDSDETIVWGEGWKSVSNWRKLTTDMRYSDVKNILGEPYQVDGGNIARWYYQNGGEVVFMGNKVYQWNEPRK